MEHNAKSRGGARPGSGRKLKAISTAMLPVSIKMSAQQKDKLALLGGPQWVREKIDKAKVPT